MDGAAGATGSGDAPNLEILEAIGRGPYCVVHRAKLGDRKVTAKIRRDDLIGEKAEEADRRLRREAALLARLDDPSLPEVLDVGRVEGRACLVLEHGDGRSLASELEAGPLPEPAVVALARQLAGALSEVHHHGLVHRGVTTAGVMVDAAGRARLFDLGLALDPAHDSPAEGSGSPEEVVGALQYCAPEQTRMIQRPVDARSDLYALGAVLFECATGRPPFVASEPKDLLHLHAAVPASDPRSLRPELSAGLARIILKLLAKDPDDRHSCAESLIFELDALGRPLDRSSSSPSLSFEELAQTSSSPFVGRDAEVGALFEAWTRVLAGNGAAVAIQGEGGAGKTRLLRELTTRIERGGVLALVSCCSHGAAGPFTALREALDGVLARAERLPPTARREAEDKFREAARGLGPALRGVLSRGADLLPEEREKRPSAKGELYDALAACVARLIELHGSALWVIDDVPALDEDSQEVLRRVARHSSKLPLLVVMAARDDESSSGKLDELLADFGWERTRRMHVGPLSAEATEELIRESLGGKRRVDRAVIESITARAGGNPFAVGEYLRTMLDAGVLLPERDEWRLDREGLTHLVLPRDLLRLMLDRIAGLSEKTRDLLTTAAVWRGPFDLAFLLRSTGEPVEVGQAAILEASGLRLIERAARDAYVLIHDRVREALLVRLDQDELRRRHLRIADALEAEGPRDAHVYALPRHLAAAQPGVDPKRVALASFRAGRKALSEYANLEARAFLEEAKRMVHQAGAEADPELDEALGEVYARTGRLEAASAHLERALAATEDPIHRAQLRVRRARAHFAHSDVARARREIEQGFRELGYSTSSSDLVLSASALWYWTKGAAAALVQPRPSPLERPARDRQRALLALLELSGRLAYLEGRPLETLDALVRSLYEARRLAPSRELADTHSNYGAVLALLGYPKAAREHAREAIEICRELDDREALARSLLQLAWIETVTGDAGEAERLAKSALEEHGAWLESGDYLTGCSELAWNLLVRGYAREALSWLERAELREGTAEGIWTSSRGHVYRAAIGSALAMLGRHVESQDALDAYREVVAGESRERYRRAQYLAHQAIALLEQGELGDRLERVISAHRALRINSAATPFHARHFQVAEAWVRLERMRAVEPGARAALDPPLKRAIRELERAATVPILQAHLLAVKGARFDLLGKDEKALEPLARAEDAARNVDSAWVCFEVARHRALMLTERGNAAAAHREAIRAHQLALEHGWAHRASKLATRYSLRSPEVGSLATTGEVTSARIALELDALMQVSMAFAKVLDPDEQARIALDQIIRIMNAERAFLFVSPSDGDRLELHVARDWAGNDLLRDEPYSVGVLETVRSSREPLVVNAEGEGQRSQASRGARSIMAAPLMRGGRLAGVVYLESHSVKGAFGEDSLGILQAISNYLHFALEATRSAQLEVYHRIAANVPGAVYRLVRRSDGNLEIPFISEGCRELFGVEPGELLKSSRSLLALLHPPDRAAFLKSLEQSAAVLLPWRFEGRVRALGREKWIRGAARPERLSSGDVIWDGLFIDITDRKRVEQELELALEEKARAVQRERERTSALEEVHRRLLDANRRILEERERALHAEKLSSIGRLAAGVAHEIANPLTGVMACAKAIAANDVPESRRGEYLETITEGLERIQTTVRSLLDYASPQTSQESVVDAAELVATSIRLIRPRLQREEVTVDVGIGRGQVWIRGNKNQLMQAVMNVLLNAVHASAPGSSVEVRHETAPDGRIGLVFIDHGCGIPQECLRRVCDPFFTTKPQGEGTGLGLAVTLGIIEAHGGQLTIDSEEGKGTRVGFWFPPRTGERADEPPPEQARRDN